MRSFAGNASLALVLFALWVLLSGELDAFHLGLGAASAAAATVATGSLLRLPPPLAPRSPTLGEVVRFLGYLPWLMREIVVSSFQVAAVVLQRRMPISPRVIRVRAPLPHTLAQLTLANSITLTPGTVTLDVQGVEMLVHALTDTAARGLQPEDGSVGPMAARIAAIFRDTTGADGTR